jgi:hypothetical protein
LMVKLPMPGPAALVFLVLTCRPRLAATPDRTALLPARSAIEEAGGSSIKSNDLLYIIQQTVFAARPASLSAPQADTRPPSQRAF